MDIYIFSRMSYQLNRVTNFLKLWTIFLYAFEKTDEFL